jgi:hypothetical protein
MQTRHNVGALYADTLVDICIVLLDVDCMAVETSTITKQQQCLISGDPISTVAIALDEAKKGEVVLSAETLAILTGDVRGDMLPSMNMRLEWAKPEVRTLLSCISCNIMVV